MSHFKQQGFPDCKIIEASIKALSRDLWSTDPNYILDQSLLKYALTILSRHQLEFLWKHSSVIEDPNICKMYFDEKDKLSLDTIEFIIRHKDIINCSERYLYHGSQYTGMGIGLGFNSTFTICLSLGYML